MAKFIPNFIVLRYLKTNPCLRDCRYRCRLSLFMSLCSGRSYSTDVESGYTDSNSINLYTFEHKQMQESLKKIIDTSINPFVDQWEKEKQFPAHQVFKLLAKSGFLGVDKPTEYGGLDLDMSYMAAVLEELGSIHCGSIPMSVAINTSMSTPALAKYGSDKLKEEFLAPVIAGDAVSCLGVSEVHAGSDVAAIKTSAVRDGDDLVINGQKMWITLAHQADWICLLANTKHTTNPYMNKSLICVPMKTPGVSVTKRIEKLGNWSSDTGLIFFDNVRVPASNLIGDDGMGFMYQMQQFQEERIAGSAMTIRPFENLIDQTIAYTRERLAYGRPILDNQFVHFRLAELRTELECFKSLFYRTIFSHMNGEEDALMLASMTKLKAGKLARLIPDECLQFYGGMGYTDEMLVSRIFRDMRLVSIGGGADEVMLGIISKCMNMLPKKSKP